MIHAVLYIRSPKVPWDRENPHYSFFLGIPLDPVESFVVSMDEAGFVEKSRTLCASHGLLASCSSTQVERELGLPKKTTLKEHSYLKTSKSKGARQQAEARDDFRNIQLHLSEGGHSL